MTIKNLIITGWGRDEYLIAAAWRYRSLGECTRVRGASQRALADMLYDIRDEIKRIDILGVGLTENLIRLSANIARLRKRGVAVNWYSRYAMPKEAKEAGVEFSEEDERYPDLIEASKIQLGEEWKELLAAAGYAHRDHGDEEALADVVAAYSENPEIVPSSTRLKSILADYNIGKEHELIGRSDCMKQVRKQVQQAGQHESARVLILGETGTGKQFAAESIHSHSRRKDKRFIHYNCAYAPSRELLYSRLFGHEKGAFTDAYEKRTGLFDEADGGTLFLDEIATASPEVQSMLLTVIEQGKFSRLGGAANNPVSVNVRLICATNEDLQQMVLENKFRLDLYMRIAEFPIVLPPLRAHPEDIADIAKSYWHKLMNGAILTSSQVSDLGKYDYPGNVRELISILKQAQILNCNTPADKINFAEILSRHISLNATLLAGLRKRRGEEQDDVGIVGETSEEMLDRVIPPTFKAMCHWYAERIYNKNGSNLQKSARSCGLSHVTFKKYLNS